MGRAHRGLLFLIFVAILGWWEHSGVLGWELSLQGPLWVWAVQSAASSSSDFSEMVLAGIGLHTQEGSVHKQ